MTQIKNTDLSGLYRRYWLRSRIVLATLIGLAVAVPVLLLSSYLMELPAICVLALGSIMPLFSVSEQIVIVTAKEPEQVWAEFGGEHNPLFWVDREMATTVQHTDGRTTCDTEHFLGDRKVTYEATHTDAGLRIAVFENDTQTMSLQVECTREDEQTTVTVDTTMESRLSLYWVMLSKANKSVVTEGFERYGYQLEAVTTRLSVL
jgi:hypothetical protein